MKIDQTLRELNDDYGVERDNALKAVYLHVLSAGEFINWMKKQGKVGVQNKFPRVLKWEKANEWKVYVEENVLVS